MFGHSESGPASAYSRQVGLCPPMSCDTTWPRNARLGDVAPVKASHKSGSKKQQIYFNAMKGGTPDPQPAPWRLLAQAEISVYSGGRRGRRLRTREVTFCGGTCPQQRLCPGIRPTVQ